MRLEMNPLEMLASVAGGALAALFIVVIFGLVGQMGQVGQVSPASAPVRATLVNCISARMRSRQGATTSISAQVRRAERQCNEKDAAGGALATPLAQSVPEMMSSAPTPRATRTARNHGWRKAATPRAN